MSTIFDNESAVKLQQHYRFKDVAEMLAVSEKSIYRWVYDRRLKAHKIGGCLRIPQSELLKFINKI